MLVVAGSIVAFPASLRVHPCGMVQYRFGSESIRLAAGLVPAMLICRLILQPEPVLWVQSPATSQ